ncbi:MAG: RdgB/HAM1 family non-canonical purine NTP pyrophosphatase [Neisseriaceae bacterium]|nr:RdgB/HAM1 family non-canonical purine NTP pyrophosphatase [Neisseriaceae bacterium]
MSLFPEIVLASNNAGKIKEFSAFFAPYDIRIISQKTLNIPECAEPHSTFIENALAKARNAAKFSGKPALADDSGICAVALNGKPGIHSARFAGIHQSDAGNNAKLSEMLQPFENKKVYYACCLVLMRHENDPMPLIAEGVWEGVWTHQPKGENGFGYDPHFYIPEYRQTAAEISGSLKNRISHRGLALIDLMKKLDDLYLRAGLSIPQIPHFVTGN